MMELSQLSDLGTMIAHLLRTELGHTGSVSMTANQVIVSISRFDFEHHLGNLLQQVYQTVDQRLPVRNEHVSLIVKDAEGTYEQLFKIWKSSAS